MITSQYDVALELYNPAGTRKVADLTAAIYNSWRRTTRRRGGNWQGSFEFSGSRDEMFDLFFYGLDRLLIERYQSIMTWCGFVAEMTLTYNGVSYKRSLLDSGWRLRPDLPAEPIANAIQMRYRKLGDNLVTNPSCESSAWTAYNAATVTQSTDWVTHGAYGSKVVVADTTIRGATIQSTIAVTAGLAYEVSIEINAVSGSWRVSCNRADTDESLCFFSTRGQAGTFVASMRIDESNRYTGNVDFRITSEAAAGTLYADNATFHAATTDATSSWLLDVNSIAELGRIENVIQRGEITEVTATQELATILTNTRWPRTRLPDRVEAITSGDLTPGRDKVAVTVLGLAHSLRRYNQLSGTANASVHVTNLATNYSTRITSRQIDTNTLQYQIPTPAAGVPLKVWPLLDEIARASDTANGHWLCGVFGQTFIYAPIQSTPAYQYSRGRLAFMKGGLVEPWMVMPAYVQLSDLPRSVAAFTGNALDVLDVALLDEVSVERGKLNLSLA